MTRNADVGRFTKPSKDVAHQVVGHARFQISLWIVLEGFVTIPALKHEIIGPDQLVKGKPFATDVAATVDHVSDTAEIIMASDDKVDPDTEMVVMVIGPSQFTAPFDTTVKPAIDIRVMGLKQVDIHSRIESQRLVVDQIHSVWAVVLHEGT
jgi:hypothetical protein